MGRTKLVVAPTSGRARPQSLQLDLEEDSDQVQDKMREPPDIEVMIDGAVQRALNAENMRKHLLLVGALKDDDARDVNARPSQSTGTPI